jgi:hypothetical protein
MSFPGISNGTTLMQIQSGRTVPLKNTVRNTSRRIKVKPMCWTTFEAANAAKSSVSGPAWQREAGSNPRIRHRVSRSPTPLQVDP